MSRACKCGGEWPRCTARVNGGQWHISPGLATPWRQWCREKLPPSHHCFVIAADDGFARTWRAFGDQLGYVKPLEVKTRGGRPSRKDNMTLKALQEHRIGTPMVIRLEGNVPGDIEHWPSPCCECDLPERLMVSAWIEANSQIVTEDQLITMLIQHPEMANGQLKEWTT